MRRALAMKRQMGKYLIPMCKPSKDELTLQKHLFPNKAVPHHHPNEHKSRRASGNSDNFHKYDSPRNLPDHPQHTGGIEPHKRPNKIPPTALMSSRSFCSSSSSTSLLSESSFDDYWHFQLSKSQHSVSCSNLPEARIFQDDALRISDFTLSDSAFSVQTHQQKQEHFGHSGKQQQISELGLGKSPLYRSHSESVERLQGVNQGCSSRAHGTPHPLEVGQLYKSASLGQNLADNGNSAATQNLTRPKRAVSSIQLPSKSILKNKDGGQKHGNVRKAKSMQALYTKRQITGPYKQGSMEAFKDNFVKEKIEFSAFLDEITRQVICPSRLSSFRLNSNSIAPSDKLSHECPRQPAKSSNQKTEHVQKSTKAHSIWNVQSDIKKGRTNSNNQGHKCITRSSTATLHQHQNQPSKEKQQFTPENYIATTHKQPDGKYSQLRTKGTSTSSVSITQENHYPTKSKWCNNGGYRACREVNTENNASSLPAVVSIDFTKKSSTANTPNMENINRHRYTGHKKHSKQAHRDSVSSMHKAQLLEHYNRDVHENSVQLVSCIENMEAELQFTKTKLNSVKEKCKRLQEDYNRCQLANSVLEQKLQSVMHRMNSHQKDHFLEISELTKQLDTGKKIIISTEDTNIPSLIKELMDSHFDSEDALKNFLLHCLSCSQSDLGNSRSTLGVVDNQSSSRKRDDLSSVWLLSGQGDSADKQEHVAAFWPWAEGQDPSVTLEKTDASALLDSKAGNSKLHSAAVNINSAMYGQTPDTKTKAHVHRVTKNHLDLQTEIASISMLAHRPGEVLSNQHSFKEITGTREWRAEGCAGIAQQESDEVTYLTAQKILDNFKSQISSQSKQRQMQGDLVESDWIREPTDGP